MTPRLFLEIQAQLDGWCDLVVAPDFIRELRLVKSPQELDYLRRAGEISTRPEPSSSSSSAKPTSRRFQSVNWGSKLEKVMIRARIGSQADAG